MEHVRRFFQEPSFWCLILVLAVGAIIRGIAVPHGLTFHPDERHIVMTTMQLGWGNWNPGSFAYGSFPFYLLRIVSGSLALIWSQALLYDSVFLIGRWLSVGIAVLTAVGCYQLSCLLFLNRWIGVLAAAFLSLNSFHIQLSHFYTVDTLLTLTSLYTLIGIIRISKKGRFQDYLFTGAMLGLSLGTKVSALSLFFPTVLAHVSFHRTLYQASHPRNFTRLFVLALIAMGVCILVMPYLVLDPATVWKHMKEQIDMVQGVWTPPYTVQYLNTAPYLYPLHQMLWYTMGVPMMVASLIGLGISLFRWKDRSTWILALWVVIYFLIVGKYQVKFPRYLLPLYPVLFVFAAHFLWIIHSKFFLNVPRWITFAPAVSLLIWSFISAVGFTSIYLNEHPYQGASRWIFDHIPAGAKLLGPHWDDRLPLTLPGHPAQIYRFEGAESDLVFYEPDTEEKLMGISRRMSEADYVVFPTPRIQGSVLRVPRQYPLTSKLLKQLYQGELGYELVYTGKNYPMFGNSLFNDDLADESLTVYDHPKVVIFQNMNRLSSAEIAQRVRSSPEEASLPSMNQILLASQEESSSLGVVSKNGFSTWLSVLVWFGAIEILSFMILPFLFLALPKSPDGGFGLSKALGIFSFGFILWLAASLGFTSMTSSDVQKIFLLFGCAVTWFISKHGTSIRAYFSERGSAILFGEILWVGVFLLFLWCRAYQPELFWGEKPMDSSFLRYMTRLESLPATDPWAPGNELHYYYLGTYLLGVVQKLTGVPVEIGYNLSLATLAGILAISTFSIVLSLTEKILIASLGAIALVCSANFEILRLAFFGDRPIGFDLFWASTRLFTSPSFTEYPTWSLLFGDLHAHLIALPFVVCLLALGKNIVEWEHSDSPKFPYVHRVFYGAILGSLIALNTWDFIACGAFTIILYFVRGILSVQEGSIANRINRGIEVVLDGAFTAVMALIAASPALHALYSGNPIGWGFVTGPEFNSISQIFFMYGTLLVPLCIAGLVALRYAYKGKFFLLRAWPALIPLIFACYSLFHDIHDLPWGILLLSSTLIALPCLLSGEKGFLYPACLSLFGGIVLAGGELFFLESRMNTIFKFYHPLWFFFGIAALGIMGNLSSIPFGPSRIVRHRAGFAFSLLLFVGCAGGILAMMIMTSFQRVPGPRPTLDGIAYLQTKDPEEYALISWMNSHIHGTPTVLEAWGEAYREFTRISMHTGLPTVLGWEHHVYQRGVSRAEISHRQTAISKMYGLANPDDILPLLRKYQVKYIVSGKIESQKYPTNGLEKFRKHPELFPVLFRKGNTTLYGTPLTFGME